MVVMVVVAEEEMAAVVEGMEVLRLGMGLVYELLI